MSTNKLQNLGKTLLLRHFEYQNSKQVPSFRFVSPLVEIRIYDLPIDLTKRLPVRLDQLQLKDINYLIKLHLVGQMRKRHSFYRLATMYSSFESNARRSRLINLKRQAVLTCVDQFGEDGKLYTLVLNQVVEFVPEEEFVRHVVEGIRRSQERWHPQEQTQIHSETSLRSVLFPYQHNLWLSVLKERLTKFRIPSQSNITNTFLQIELFAVYKLQFSPNRDNFYKDIRDFAEINRKFNFVEFFHKASNDSFLSKKYIERLIKSIQWRTKESQEFLIVLRRATQFEQFLYALEVIVDTYDASYQNDSNKH